MNLSILKTYRAQLEDRLQAECVELLRTLEEAQAVRARLEADEVKHAQAFLGRSREGMMPAEACDHIASMDALASVILKTKEREATIQESLQQKRIELLDASRERKKIELLEERQATAAYREEERRAQQAMDEVAGRLRYRHKDVP